MSYSITQHAEMRMNQRGIRKEDLGLLLATADQVASDAYLMTNEIADEEIARRKKEIQQFERLRGKKLIVEGGIIITSYHATRRDQTKTYRKGRAYA